MLGTLTDGYPVLDIPIQLPGMPALRLSFVIDTGFAGYLTLPFFYQMPARLADGSRKMTNVHLVTIRWHDELREVEVLAGSRLTIDFVSGGELTILEVS